ncbi:MAG: hypothetical protein QME92_01075 [Bacillota bacterium]|nr:hypothetical protein [Bacillota bacterium]
MDKLQGADRGGRYHAYRMTQRGPFVKGGSREEAAVPGAEGNPRKMEDSEAPRGKHYRIRKRRDGS